jgi:peroxiredoxin
MFWMPCSVRKQDPVWVREGRSDGVLTEKVDLHPMSLSRRKIIVPLFFVLGLIAMYAIRTPFQGFVEPVTEGTVAPDFALKDLEGKEVRLSDYQGKVVLLNFWATWCPPCREEMPSMESLYRAMEGRPFEMLAVSVDESAEHVQGFRDHFGYTFPILLDGDQRAASQYQTTGFPETFLIGPDGTIRKKYVGPFDWEARERVAEIEESLP